MTQNEIDKAVVRGLIRVLCTICAANEEKTIDILTGYLWDGEEAEEIKRSSGKFEPRNNLDN